MFSGPLSFSQCLAPNILCITSCSIDLLSTLLEFSVITPYVGKNAILSTSATKVPGKLSTSIPITPYSCMSG